MAISFAFPGPADYPTGIIGDLGNLPGFRGGVALGPMLEEKFGIPVFINNDGDLFVYGEAIAGFLPYVNGLLEKAGSPKRYKNLFGVTLGTGFGGGIVRDGELFIGDNSIAGEVWLLRNKLAPGDERRGRRQHPRRAPRLCGEGRHSLRAGARAQGDLRHRPGQSRPATKPPRRKRSADWAKWSATRMGNALTLVDGLAVIGGGMSGAWPLFLPALVAELNGTYTGPNGKQFRRLASKAFQPRRPGADGTILRGRNARNHASRQHANLKYDPAQRIGVGMSRLGTSEAVAIGAYAFALRKLGSAH